MIHPTLVIRVVPQDGEVLIVLILFVKVIAILVHPLKDVLNVKLSKESNQNQEIVSNVKLLIVKFAVRTI